MSVVDEARDLMGLSKRKRVLGLPIGPKQTNWGRAAWGAGAAAAGVIGTAAVIRHSGDDEDAPATTGDTETTDDSSESPSLVERGRSLATRPRETLEQGKDALENVSEVGNQVSDASSAMGEHSSTLGKLRGAVHSFGSNGEQEQAGDEKKQRLIIQEQIDVTVPRSVAYDRWRTFDDFEEIARAIQQSDEVGDHGRRRPHGCRELP